MRISSSGLTAERFRMDVISSNIANANSVGIKGQDPYRRRDVVLEAGTDGVQIVKIQEDDAPFRTEYDPNNENADAEGFVKYSNVQPIYEMVNMISATRAYEANLAAFNTAKGMAKAALNIGKM
ncbi:MAG: flagellar basal body rod protein FlgC [Fimbriimonadaceae bacterium]|nr:flagellar basal body rod protein FlgC [Fimbriimonadaceae bacterium]